ncbi:hypothetical protein KBZ08_02055 [Cyanobium sp. Candia 9D4]|uniref:DUF234 domain-containing protein n=1 Tax=Cyanobium sp. Candia 9D4 TaxID=2823707 RepID=UPI0020CCF7EA|nr:DUF234 domain-containing protein [Cyanobium sp. Candia 9D4]MCP9932692.1 hypothetical protein [Cyanobium sp. Candia 9D4]
MLGSLHTGMQALLEDRSAPLYQRLTDTISLAHLDIASLLERMFFSSSSPLRTEADNWFLREFRGRYDLVLKYVARHPGCTHAELQANADSVAPEIGSQVGGYLKTLEERYEMVEKRLPVFAKPKARKGHYTIRDNFLRSWQDALERLVGQLYEERSRLGLGDFPLSSRTQGWWDSRDTEIDLVALDEPSQRLRLGSCKRSELALVKDLANFDGHVARFLKAFPRFEAWQVEKVAIAPSLSPEARQAIAEAGYLPQSLIDLTAELLPTNSGAGP